jgi:hypothetical protein
MFLFLVFLILAYVTLASQYAVLNQKIRHLTDHVGPTNGLGTDFTKVG